MAKRESGARWRAERIAGWVTRWVDGGSGLRRFVTLFAITVVMRAGAFAERAVDWDESVYVLMARSLLRGRVPYTAVWDHKPPGIYFLFALVELAGGSVIAIRFLTCAALAMTAWAILSIWRTLFARGDRDGAPRGNGDGDGAARAGGGWVAALMFLGLAQRYAGNTTNTEHFFVALVALGFALLLPLVPLVPPFAAEPWTRPGRWRAFLVGLLWGAALQVKFVILVDVAVFMALLAWVDLQTAIAAKMRAPAATSLPASRPARAGTSLLIRLGAPVALGLIVPSVGVVLFFWVRGAMHEYVYANFLANLHHANDRTKLRGTIDFMATIVNSAPFLWGLALVVAPVLHLAGAAASVRLRANLLGAWLLMTSAAVLAPGQPYLHYAVQTALPCALLAAFALERLVLSQLSSRLYRAAVIAVALFSVHGVDVFAWTVSGMNLVSRVVHVGPPHPDVADSVATYLRPRLDAGADRLIYVEDWQPILYELADARWPTRYLFPPFLADPHFVRVAGSDPPRELASILRQHPLYIVRRQLPEPRYAAFRRLADDTFAADYRLETVIDGVELLRFKDAPAPP